MPPSDVPSNFLEEAPEKQYYFHHYGYKMTFNKECLRVICRASFGVLFRSASIAGRFVGIYITGSIHHANINGVKLVDHNGLFFDDSWRSTFDSLVNSTDLFSTFNKLIRNSTNYKNHSEIPAKVLIAHDNRPTSSLIVKHVLEVIGEVSQSIVVHNYEMSTFPEFVYLIRKANELHRVAENDYLPLLLSKVKLLQQLTGRNIDLAVDTGNEPFKSIWRL